MVFSQLSCCGVYNYSDWKLWSHLLPTVGNNSLPNSCCKNTNQGTQATSNPCNNDKMLEQPPASIQYKNINKEVRQYSQCIGTSYSYYM
jgi:hypothetical protein